MFVVRITVHPALGKFVEAREISEKFFKSRQAKGKNESLQVRLFSKGGSLVGVFVYDSLAEYEKARTANATDPEWQEVSNKLTALSREVSETEVYEFLVPPKM